MTPKSSLHFQRNLLFRSLRTNQLPRAARSTGDHDVLLFQIGNDPLHAPSVEALCAPGRKTPAVVVLHDFVLHHLFAAAYLDRGREADYARALEAAHGARGRAFAEEGRRGPRIPVWDLDPWAFPMSAAVVRAAEAVIAHSALVRGAVLRESPKARVVEIPHHVVAAPAHAAGRGAPRARAAARPAGRGVARRRDAREENREDPRGARVPSGRPPAVPVRRRRRRRGRPAPPVRRRARPREGRRVRRLPLGRGLLARRLCGGLRRESPAPDDGGDVRRGLPARRLRPAARRFGHRLVPRAARTRSRRRCRWAATRFRASRPRWRRSPSIPERTRARSAAAVGWGEARRPDRIAEAYAGVLRGGRGRSLRARSGLAGFVAHALVEVGVGRAGSVRRHEPRAGRGARRRGRLAARASPSGDDRREEILLGEKKRREEMIS